MLNNDFYDLVAVLSGIALLDYLIEDTNYWIIDHLKFDDITEDIHFKLYKKCT